MNRNESAGGIVLFLFGAVTTVASLRMPLGTFRNAGTGLFPLILGILLMILSGLFLVRLVVKKQATREQLSVGQLPASSKQLLLFFGTMVSVTLFFNRLGYPLSSFLVMVALLKILGMKRWSSNILISLPTAVVCYFLFVQWLKIPLPKGWLGL